MSFIYLPFFIFFILFVPVYYLLPSRLRYVAVFVGSYLFYGWGHPLFLATLILITVWTYLGGLVLERKNSRKNYVLFFVGCIAVLGIYKYSAFVLQNLNAVGKYFGRNALQIPEYLVPVGLSFYIFQACTYLGDVHHGKLTAEHNVIRYASFVSFFPSILSGPIQKARNLLPQIQEPETFSAENAIAGFLKLLWGIFEKVCIADQLSGILNGLVIEETDPWKASWHLLSAIVFSLYIYADFSGYSDMAIGLAEILGIRMKRNFNNPYLSLTLAEFWERWHVSLNEWLVEYVYIPLGGNRKGKVRKYFNVMAVFLISGLWHGAYWHYVIWGVLNGALMVLGQITSPIRHIIWRRCGFDEQTAAVRFWKRGIVSVLITVTWMFFRNGVGTAIRMIVSILSSPLMSYCNPNIWNVCGTVSKTVMVMGMTIVFLVLQCQRNGRSSFADAFRRQPALFQYLCIGVMLTVCIFVGAWSSASVNTEFLYFQF
ncbi:MBOAT family O-acyltransferase [Bacillota bacterium HCP3S3_F1_1]